MNSDGENEPKSRLLPPATSNYDIGTVLSRLKELRKVTLRHLEETTGIPNPTIHAILTGRTENPGFMNGVALANALGVTAEELYRLAILEKQQPKES